MNNGYKIDPYNKSTNAQNQSGGSNNLLVPEWKKVKPQVTEGNKNGITVVNLGGSNSNRPVSDHTFVTDLTLTAPTTVPPPFKKSNSEGTLPSKMAKSNTIIQSDNTQNNSKYNIEEKTNLSNSSQSFDTNFPDLVPSKKSLGPKSKSQEKLLWPGKDLIIQTTAKSKEAETLHDKPAPSAITPETNIERLKNIVLVPKKLTKNATNSNKSGIKEVATTKEKEPPPPTFHRKTRSAERLTVENSAIIRQPESALVPLEKGMLVLSSKKKDKKIKKVEKTGDTLDNSDSSIEPKIINGGNRESTSHSNSDPICQSKEKCKEKKDMDEVTEFKKKLGLDPNQLDDSALTEEEIVQFKQNHKRSIESVTQGKQERIQHFKDKLSNWATNRNTVFYIPNEDEISSGSSDSETNIHYIV